MVELIKKLYNLICKVASDKLLHAIAGLIIFEISFKIIDFISVVPTLINVIVSTIITLVILIGKEIYDKNHEGYSVEIADIVAGIIGMIVGLIIMIL